MCDNLKNIQTHMVSLPNLSLSQTHCKYCGFQIHGLPGQFLLTPPSQSPIHHYTPRCPITFLITPSHSTYSITLPGTPNTLSVLYRLPISPSHLPILHHILSYSINSPLIPHNPQYSIMLPTTLSYSPIIHHTLLFSHTPS